MSPRLACRALVLASVLAASRAAADFDPYSEVAAPLGAVSEDLCRGMDEQSRAIRAARNEAHDRCLEQAQSSKSCSISSRSQCSCPSCEGLHILRDSSANQDRVNDCWQRLHEQRQADELRRQWFDDVAGDHNADTFSAWRGEQLSLHQEGAALLRAAGDRAAPTMGSADLARQLRRVFDGSLLRAAANEGVPRPLSNFNRAAGAASVALDALRENSLDAWTRAVTTIAASELGRETQKLVGPAIAGLVGRPGATPLFVLPNVVRAGELTWSLQSSALRDVDLVFGSFFANGSEGDVLAALERSDAQRMLMVLRAGSSSPGTLDFFSFSHLIRPGAEP